MFHRLGSVSQDALTAMGNPESRSSLPETNQIYFSEELRRCPYTLSHLREVRESNNVSVDMRLYSSDEKINLSSAAERSRRAAREGGGAMREITADLE